MLKKYWVLIIIKCNRKINTIKKLYNIKSKKKYYYTINYVLMVKKS